MEKEIRKYVRAQLNLLAKDDRTLEQSGAKAQLAQLRRGVESGLENFLSCGGCF